jgi:hypothetical protein
MSWQKTVSDRSEFQPEISGDPRGGANMNRGLVMKKLLFFSMVLSGSLLIACQNLGQLQSHDETLQREQPEQLEQQRTLQQKYGVSPQYDNQIERESPQKPTQVHGDDQPGQSTDMTRDPSLF